MHATGQTNIDNINNIDLSSQCIIIRFLICLNTLPQRTGFSGPFYQPVSAFFFFLIGQAIIKLAQSSVYSYSMIINIIVNRSVFQICFRSFRCFAKTQTSC